MLMFHVGSFLSITKRYSVCLSIHLLLDIWIVFKFWLLSVKLLWKFVCKSLCWHLAFLSLGLISGSGLARSYDWYIFNILRNCQSVFPRGHVILYCHKQGMNVSFAPRFHWHWYGPCNFSCCNRCLMASHCAFNLHFLNE